MTTPVFDKQIATADDGVAFYTSQLSNLESKVYEAKYRKIVYQDFVPVDTSDPEWVDEVTYISYDAVTMGKFIAANGRDLPQSDINASKSTIPVGYAGNSYSYSLDELRKSQQMRIPLDSTKGRMSFRGAQEHSQRVAFFGDADRGMTGLFNSPNVASDNSVTDWATASGQEIVDDMNGLLIKIWQDSAETFVPNVLLLPSDKWSIISSRRMDSGTDTTVLSFFRENNAASDLGVALTIKPNLELKTAGTASAPRMMAYELNADNLTMKNPLPYRTVAPQAEGLSVKVNAEYKISGVEFRFPTSAAYRDFI